jgi:hypothetical protein
VTIADLVSVLEQIAEELDCDIWLEVRSHGGMVSIWAERQLGTAFLRASLPIQPAALDAIEPETALTLLTERITAALAEQTSR